MELLLPSCYCLMKNRCVNFGNISIETVCRCEQENLWTLLSRGIGDQPYWAAFEDAPVSEEERAEVINRMLHIQLAMIKEKTGNPNPFVRVTFYDELSDSFG